MKILKIIIAMSIMISASGCNQYIKTTDTTNNHVYYGAFNRRDMIHADVIVFEKGSDKICDGAVYINAPSRSITFKNDRVDAKMVLGCNDGTLMDLSWQLRKGSFNDGFGEGIDQLNNKYKFASISKSQFKEIAEVKKVNFHTKTHFLKY